MKTQHVYEHKVYLLQREEQAATVHPALYKDAGNKQHKRMAK